MKTIEIRRWDNDEVIFLHTSIYNTNKETLKLALNQGFNLSYADLRNYNLDFIDLSNANLLNAKLINCSLFYANLSGANLTNVKLIESDLSYADLTNANLTDADLSYSIISRNTKISCEQLANVKGINNQCPKEGTFIGWKKCVDSYKTSYIVKLEIPADAKRSSSTSEKCRCSKAKVLEIQNLDGTIADITEVYSYSYEFKNSIYRINEIIYPDWFDDRFWIECSNGIHFFINRKDAVEYIF